MIPKAENFFEPNKDVDMDMAKQSNEFIIKMICHGHQLSPFVTSSQLWSTLVNFLGTVVKDVVHKTVFKKIFTLFYKST